jgi:diaminohydroxyphosphoribosylaminopyrimidine deaminase/5-amino-6-(5-phosphoribosylamino)uracil reductase
VILDASGKIVGEGFHDRMSSKDHAEVVAIASAGNLAKGATMVVTLEPCNHTGSTGPCTQAIIDSGISTVVFAVSDPNVVAAGGADALRAAGIKVVDGVLAKEASYANRAWLTKIEKIRPYFVWKVATTNGTEYRSINVEQKCIPTMLFLHTCITGHHRMKSNHTS